ncbi:MAG: replicative helicase loader/inhibitor [Acutalibacteraceae bacterium]|nr:replicative helicase loader/inhibitor [Acutalibacteraceae bacterium]
MDKKEAAQLLAIIKCAYPAQYKNLQDNDAKITISLWQMHFAKIPATLVFDAVNRHISKSAFAPTIKEINDELRNIHLHAMHLVTDIFGQYSPAEMAKAEQIDTLLSQHEQDQRRLPECINTETKRLL